MNNHVRLIQKARSTGFLFSLIVLFGFFASGLIIWQSWLLSGVVSKVFLEKQTLNQVAPILRLFLLIVSGRVIFTVFNESLAGRLAVRIKNGLRKELLEKIDRLGPIFLRGETSGELATTALQGLDGLDAYFSQFLPQILLAALLPLTILIVVFPVDLLTGIVFSVTAPLIPLFMVLIGRLSESQTKRQWNALSRLGAYFLDTLQGLSTLMVLGRSKQRADEVREMSDRYRMVTMNVLKITFLSAFVLEMIATISTALVAVEIGLRLLYSHIAFQQAFFILLIAPEFYLPLRNLSMRYHAGMSGLTAATRIFALLDTPEQKVTKTFNERLSSSFTGDFKLTFKDVSFKYPGTDTYALQGINLEVSSGKHYALVGASGAGKSTLAALLLRFIAPDEGVIALNGEDIQSWDADEWRRNIGWVPQHPQLFNTSLLENVRLFDPRISRSQVEEVLKMCSLGTLQASLVMGLDAPLLEGGIRLSGGEAQRLVLARAYLKNAPLLLMDEPTSHLDLDLELDLTNAIHHLQQSRTSLAIAHRLGTVVSADHIFVLQAGRLVEEGTHPQLIIKHGEYDRLLEAARRIA